VLRQSACLRARFCAAAGLSRTSGCTEIAGAHNQESLRGHSKKSADGGGDYDRLVESAFIREEPPDIGEATRRENCRDFLA
jgi:hypothetical protein